MGQNTSQFPSSPGVACSVMAFATPMTGEKIQARDAVLGLAIAATKVLKVACACLSNDNAEGSGEESPRNRT